MDKTLVLVDVKMVLVGDGSVGKTSLLVSYTKDLFSEDYDPTVFDHFMTTVRVGNTGVKLSMWDTPGQGDYDRFRPLAYSSADIFLVCFSIDDPMSLDNIFNKWIPQIDQHKGNAPKILIGTKCDLRQGLYDRHANKRTDRHVIPYGILQNSINQKGYQYIECSSLTQYNLKEMFQKAITEVLGRRETKKVRVKKQKTMCCLI